MVVLLFALMLGATALYATRTVRRAIYWREHRDEPIRGWMTIGYVAHSYRVPARVLYDALGLPPHQPGTPHERRPLREIAREQGRTVEEIAVVLQEAIARERAAQNAHAPRGQPPNDQLPNDQRPNDQPPNDQRPNAPPAHGLPRGEGGRP